MNTAITECYSTYILHSQKSNLVFQYLSFTDTRLREWNILSLSAIHPYSNCLPILLPSSTSFRVLEAKVCYVVKQLQQVSGHLENTHTHTYGLQCHFYFNGYVVYRP